MTGNNSVILNQATMQKAIQHYFDTVLFRDGVGVKVTGVKRIHNGNSETFEVTTAEGLNPVWAFVGTKLEETDAATTR